MTIFVCKCNGTGCPSKTLFRVLYHSACDDCNNESLHPRIVRQARSTHQGLCRRHGMWTTFLCYPTVINSRGLRSSLNTPHSEPDNPKLGLVSRMPQHRQGHASSRSSGAANDGSSPLAMLRWASPPNQAHLACTCGKMRAPRPQTSTMRQRRHSLQPQKYGSSEDTHGTRRHCLRLAFNQVHVETKHPRSRTRLRHGCPPYSGLVQALGHKTKVATSSTHGRPCSSDCCSVPVCERTRSSGNSSKAGRESAPSRGISTPFNGLHIMRDIKSAIE